MDGQLSLIHDLDQLLPSHGEEPPEEGVGDVFYHCALIASGIEMEPHYGKVRNGVKVTPLT